MSGLSFYDRAREMTSHPCERNPVVPVSLPAQRHRVAGRSPRPPFIALIPSMPPTQGTVAAAPTPMSSAKSPTHQVSIPAMVALALFLSMTVALAIGVILRQRSAMAALKYKENIPQDKHRSARASWSWVSRFKSRLTAADADDPTAVGALHATSVLLAAAPYHVFSPPMTMYFRIPLEDKTILILGAPWFPAHCGAQYCGAPAVRISPHLGQFEC